MAVGTNDPAVRSKDPMERLQRLPRDVLKLMEPISLFDELNLRERSMLSEVAEVVRCIGGTKVFDAGDEGKYLYCVLQGRLDLRTGVATGLTHSVREIPAGRLAGLDAVLTQQPYHMMCMALENTAALRFHTHQLHQLLAAGTPAAIKLFAALRTELGNDIRTATLQVVKLLDATSVRGSSMGMPGMGTPTVDGTPAVGSLAARAPVGQPVNGIHGVVPPLTKPGRR